MRPVRWVGLEPGVEGPDRVGDTVVAASDADELTWASWSVLDRRTAMRMPVGLVMRSSMFRAEISPGLIAEA